MSPINERKTGSNPLVIARSFAAPRELVFKAWSSADHIKRWFSPEGCSVPEAEVDFRPGGAFVVCMRLPDGRDFWSRGAFGEISPPRRLSFVSSVIVDGEKRFTADTTVSFEEEGRGA
ncbi:MAG: SRPBCC family protein, partial [Roseiarcus sp.]